MVDYGFETINTVTGNLDISDNMKLHISNFDETCMSLDGSNGSRGGRPSTTYYDVRFP